MLILTRQIGEGILIGVTERGEGGKLIVKWDIEITILKTREGSADDSTLGIKAPAKYTIIRKEVPFDPAKNGKANKD